jgi:microsomal dipeptidase-like Zn-dependent dipeptidase
MSTFTSILTYKEFAPVPAALLASGFTEEQTRKLLGGNVIRVIDTALRAV